MAYTTAELLELFDDWLAPSVGLRQYLWGHRQESIETARKLIELIPPVMLKTVLGYLVLNYWEHRSGWPDLLVYRANQWFLAEVKSWSKCTEWNLCQRFQRMPPLSVGHDIYDRLGNRVCFLSRG